MTTNENETNNNELNNLNKETNGNKFNEQEENIFFDKKDKKEDCTNEKGNNIDLKNEFQILPSNSTIFDYNYKVIIIGDSGVGKTCLSYRITTGKFFEKISATVGFEYYQFLVKYKGKIIKMELWDTCGQETYRSLIRSFFTNASMAIIVYAIDDKKTFVSIDEWIRQCRDLCAPDTKFFLIGNKNDVDESE